MALTIWADQRANLARLADYLAALPDDYARFRMIDYANIDTPDGYHSIDIGEFSDSWKNDCGTCACAVGHGPLAGIPLSDDDTTWTSYCARVFGLYIMGQPGDRDGEVWDDLFGPANPNDPHAAAARIRAFLETLS